jgi:Tfp pilus assembly protein PilF
LKDPERRDKYRQDLEGKPEAEARPELEAEKYLQQGMRSVRARDWSNAQEMFEKAVELKPDEPEYYGSLGWAIYCNEEMDFNERRDTAIEKLGAALEMNPNMDAVHVFLGKIFKDEGNVNEAVAEFRVALQCNPNCREAARELKAHGFDESGGVDT